MMDTLVGKIPYWRSILGGRMIGRQTCTAGSQIPLTPKRPVYREIPLIQAITADFFSSNGNSISFNEKSVSE